MIKHLWCKATIITQLHLGAGCKGQRRVGAVVGWPQHRRGTWETTVTFTCTVVKYQQKAAWSCRLTATPSSAVRTNWKKPGKPSQSVMLTSSQVSFIECHLRCYWQTAGFLLCESTTTARIQTTSDGSTGGTAHGVHSPSSYGVIEHPNWHGP